MKKAKWKAAACIAECAGYMGLSALLLQKGLALPAVFAAALGMLCGWICVQCGREYEGLRQKELNERADAAMEPVCGMRAVRCGNCGNAEFRRVADRFVCSCCGEVLEREQRENAV